MPCEGVKKRTSKLKQKEDFEDRRTSKIHRNIRTSHPKLWSSTMFHRWSFGNRRIELFSNPSPPCTPPRFPPHFCIPFQSFSLTFKKNASKVFAIPARWASTPFSILDVYARNSRSMAARTALWEACCNCALWPMLAQSSELQAPATVPTTYLTKQAQHGPTIHIRQTHRFTGLSNLVICLCMPRSLLRWST